MRWLLKACSFLLPLYLMGVSYPPHRAPYPPFVSGDGFRAACRYAFDELSTSLNPKKIRPYSSIFVKGDYLERFFQEVHPHISVPYLLVTHNSDDPAPGAFAHMLEEKSLIAWFAQNMDSAPHPKLHPIPIGIANRCWPHGNGDAIAAIQALALPKNTFLYLNISVATFPEERGQVHHLLSKLQGAYAPSPKPYSLYLQDLASCHFIAAPRGNGLDTHRLWEALYLNAYPIVKTSSLDPLYADLPVIIVNSWEEVTPSFLWQKKVELERREHALEKLSMQYWIHQIHAYTHP